MAQIPSKATVVKMQKATNKEIAHKKRTQKLKGKDFIPHGGGVLPEPIWKEMKK
jgi:hypothetical protein